MIGEPKNGDFVSLVENLSTAKIEVHLGSPGNAALTFK